MKMELRRKAIDKLYKRRDKIEMPEFQREEVWPESKKQTLIDSILKGWHLPKFYFKKSSDGSYECVDGQQRLNAIFEYYDDKFALAEESDLKGCKYSDLPDDKSDAFDDFEIEIDEIEDATDEELEELFRRLQLGTPLNTAEKLNAVIGEFRDFCHDSTQEPFFQGKLAIKNTRFSHFEIIARWGFIEARGVQPQMRLKQLEEFFRDNKKFSRTSTIAKTIESSLHFLDKCFTKSPRFISSRANALSVCMLASRMVKAGLDIQKNAKPFAKFLENFFHSLSAEVQKGVKASDKELLLYQQAILQGSTGGDSIRTRANILARRLSREVPSLKMVRDETQPEDRGAFHGVVNEIRDRIYKINKSYSARNGEDLFRITNETQKAFATLERPAEDKTSYGDLIDALYFLAYEGSGACKRLGGPPPEFTMDVKFLRTAVRHDVAHGSPTEIAKKMKRAGETFKKYSNKVTPDECGADELIEVQQKLLREFLEMLKALG